MTGERERLGRRLLAFTALGFFLGGILMALSFVALALVVLAALLVVNLALVGSWLLHRVRIGPALGNLSASAAGAVEAQWRRLRGFGVRRRAQRLLRDLRVRRRTRALGARVRETSTRAPDRASALLASGLRSYTVAVHRSRIRTTQVLRAAGERGSSLSRLKPRSTGSSRQALRLNELGAQLRRRGEHEQAVEQHLVALGIVRDLGDEQAEALTLNNLGLALAQGGAEEEAVQHLERALVVLRELGDEKHEARVMANLGMVHRRQGHSEQAVSLLHEALDRLPPESPAYRQVEAELRRAS